MLHVPTWFGTAHSAADWKGAKSMQLQLDTQDIHLLKEIAELGDVSAKVFDQGRRLERLEVEGYVSSVRQDPPGLEAAPTWVYRLTLKGRAVATRH
jgi:hypothetical protein